MAKLHPVIFLLQINPQQSNDYMTNTTSNFGEDNLWKSVQRTNEQTGTRFHVRTMQGQQHPVLGNVLYLAVRTVIKRWGLTILHTYPLGSR